MSTVRKTTAPARSHPPIASPLAAFGKMAVDARTLLSAAQIDGVATLGYN
jgi:hypothetical protein